MNAVEIYTFGGEWILERIEDDRKDWGDGEVLFELLTLPVTWAARADIEITET